MRIRLVAIGTRMRAWVNEGYQEYARRMPRECSLELVEITAVRRSRGAPAAPAVAQEGKRMLAAIPAADRAIALDVGGRGWSTQELARQLGQWLADGRGLSLMVGGADGLAEACLQRAEQRWSLSPLTLPHPLVRIVVAEQLYRAWSLIAGHPYHRA